MPKAPPSSVRPPIAAESRKTIYVPTRAQGTLVEDFATPALIEEIRQFWGGPYRKEKAAGATITAFIDFGALKRDAAR